MFGAALCLGGARVLALGHGPPKRMLSSVGFLCVSSPSMRSMHDSSWASRRRSRWSARAGATELRDSGYHAAADGGGGHRGGRCQSRRPFSHRRGAVRQRYVPLAIGLATARLDPPCRQATTIIDEISITQVPWTLGQVLSNMRIGAPILMFFRASARCGSTCEKAGWPRKDLARLRRTSPYGESDMVRSVTLQRISACVLAAWPYVGRL